MWGLVTHLYKGDAWTRRYGIVSPSGEQCRSLDNQCTDSQWYSAERLGRIFPASRPRTGAVLLHHAHPPPPLDRTCAPKSCVQSMRHVPIHFAINPEIFAPESGRTRAEQRSVRMRLQSFRTRRLSLMLRGPEISLSSRDVACARVWSDCARLVDLHVLSVDVRNGTEPFAVR